VVEASQRRSQLHMPPETAEAAPAPARTAISD